MGRTKTRHIVRIPKDELPKPRLKWMRNPATHIKESSKKYSRAREKRKTRREIYEKN